MKRCILLILSCLFIQSCSSAINEQRIQGGKVSFMSGDFKSAFHQLLPLAAEGIPQAEYGVGYMYYYGYGVTQDTESGIFWMNKAAAAHYVPAIRALNAIQENNIKEARKPKPRNESAPVKTNNVHAENTVADTNLDKDAVLEALNNTPQQGHVTVMPEEDHTTLAKTEDAPQEEQTATKVNAQLNEKLNPNVAMVDVHAKKYTLQLLGSYYLSSLKERQAQLNLGVPSFIGQTTNNGRPWYVLTIGKYPALGNAELAKLDLPKKIKDYKPWIRKCDELTWVG